jgi:hypothetical protein
MALKVRDVMTGIPVVLKPEQTVADAACPCATTRWAAFSLPAASCTGCSPIATERMTAAAAPGAALRWEAG